MDQIINTAFASGMTIATNLMLGPVGIAIGGIIGITMLILIISMMFSVITKMRGGGS